MSFIGQFVHRVEREIFGGRSTSSEYMIIWCKIQVKINPLLQATKFADYFIGKILFFNKTSDPIQVILNIYPYVYCKILGIIFRTDERDTYTSQKCFKSSLDL